MIELFNQKQNQKDFLSVFNKSFIKLTNECIHNLMYNSDYFRDSIKNLSETTFKNMNEMIPESLNEIWQEGLKSNKYYMKLCGSGGGGFFLAFDFENILKDKLSSFKLLCVVLNASSKALCSCFKARILSPNSKPESKSILSSGNRPN